MANRILEMQQDRAAQLSQANQILEKAYAEKRPNLTPEEQTVYDGITQRAKDINNAIEREVNLIALQGNAINDATLQARGGGNIELVRDNFLDKPFGPPARSNENAKQRRARLQMGFGEYLLAVKNAKLQPHRIDARLLELNKRSTPLGASEQIPADGGFLVHPDHSDEILQISHDTGLVFNRCRNIPISETTNGIEIPGIDESSRANGSRWGGVQMYWQNEAEATTATKPKFRMIKLQLKKLMGLYYSTDELEADARALGSVVSTAFGEELGFKLDDGVMNGTGAGQLLGYLNAANPALISVAKESGQAAATILFENVVKMWSRLHAKSRKNAVWFTNQDVEAKLLTMALSVGTGGSSVTTGLTATGVGGIYTPAGFMGNETGMLFNRPVVAVEQANTLGSQGDISLFDPSQFIYIDKGDMQQATSMHVAFLTDQMAYRYIYRVDGQPIWHKVLTPFKGSATQSPYITLDAR